MNEPEPRDPLVGTVVAERFRIERMVGEGGMGRVYVAEHTGIGKRVALKCLNPELASNKMVVERFVREARAAAAAGNEHVVEVFDLGTLDDGSPFIVMELLEGKELRDVMDDEGPLPIGRAIRLVRQVCDALAPVHERGIVHRDLKPENVFLTKRTRDQEFVKVLDFGISKLTEPGAVQKLTGTGMTLGTPHYMSAEQAQGLSSVDHRTDVYALGVILYEMLAGKLPFDAETFPMLVVGIVTQDAPSIRRIRADVPTDLAQGIDRCLAKSPEERFENVDALSEFLAQFETIDDAPVVTGMGATIRPPRRQSANAAPTPRADANPVPSLRAEEPANTKELGGATNAPKAKRIDAASAEGPVDEAPANASVRRPIPTAWVLGGAGIGLAALGLSALVLIPSNAEVAPEAPSAPVTAVTPRPEPATRSEPVVASPSTQPEEVRFRVVAAPADARLYVDDVEFPNPLDVRRPRADRPVRIRIEYGGYQTHEELVVLDRDIDLLRSLEPTEPSRARPTVARRPNAREPRPSMASNTQEPPPRPPTPMNDRFRDDF